MGGIWIAMRIAMASPQTPDCRGGVFATRRFPRPPSPPPPPCKPPLLAAPSTIRRHGSPAYGASRFASRPVPTGHAWDSPSRALAARYLRGVERGIAARRATSLLSPTAAINQS